jgi:hypothetical protein
MYTLKSRICVSVISKVNSLSVHAVSSAETSEINSVRRTFSSNCDLAACHLRNTLCDVSALYWNTSSQAYDVAWKCPPSLGFDPCLSTTMSDEYKREGRKGSLKLRPFGNVTGAYQLDIISQWAIQVAQSYCDLFHTARSKHPLQWLRCPICSLNGLNSSFVFGKSRVHISTRRPANLAEVFRGFSQSLQANFGIVP